jgi:hypothetical protein
MHVCKLEFIQILGCYKSNPLKMNIALEIQVGLQIGAGGLLEGHLLVPMLLLPLCGYLIRPFCITILYHNSLLFIDIFHI